ncbi:2,3-dihydro-2,3-dihydroxybenzoate dehydrogenase [Streptomyces sp. NPDC102467]|uniref:2,3-dihydro-2,3-dihydroxybenzoate dehydrogenase n=1 Tax=Streptomyces sp. NPDC102467 TaxID=3366179 RepID=UPI0038131E93
MNVDETEKRVALVTGAAGGIGEAVVRALVAQRTPVALIDRDGERLEMLAKELRAAGAEAEAFPADVTDSAEVEAAIDAVEEQLGPVRYLVNGAGVLRLGPAKSLSDDDWATTFAVNTTGVFFVSRAAVNRMVPRGAGAIVTIASNAAGTARVDMSAYSASKAASSMFTKVLGLEVARYGIRCNVVAPGSTATPMLTSLWDDESAERMSVEGAPGAFRVGIPLGRIAAPTHIADAVLFLLSDRASHITMHDLTVDGGATLGR